MIKSISYWSFFGGIEETLSPKEAMVFAKEAGFEAIELALGEGKFLNINTEKKTVMDYLKFSKKIGIQISSLASGIFWKYNFCSPEVEKVNRAIETVKGMLRIANWMELDTILIIPGVVSLPRDPERPIASYDYVYNKSLEALIELSKFAENVKINIGIENVWNKFLLSPLEMRDFIDEINSPYVGVYFDVGNVVIIGYPEHWIRILGKRIKKVHLKDFKRENGTLDGFCDLLEGSVNFPEVMKALKDIKYDSFLTAEMVPPSEGLIERTSKAMDKIMKM